MQKSKVTCNIYFKKADNILKPTKKRKCTNLLKKNRGVILLNMENKMLVLIL